MESILTSVKAMVGGISEDCTDFDPELIMHINSVFSILNQLGVGPEEGFSISDDTTTWGEYLGDNKHLADVKTYIGLKVKMIFDPPQGSYLEAMKEFIKELESRISYTVD